MREAVMIRQPNDDDVAVAGTVLKAIKQIDPYFVNADTSLAKGWAMIFQHKPYSLEELLAGVIDFYTHETGGRHCMPANVLEGARRAREHRKATDSEYRKHLEQAREERSNRLAVTPEQLLKQKPLAQPQPVDEGLLSRIDKALKGKRL